MKILDIRSVDRLERAINQGRCIVSCGAPWSLTCRNQYSILTRIAENCVGWDAIVHVDIEKCPDAESILAIQSIPTIVFYGDGEETARFVGLKSLEDLQEALETICPSQLTDQPAATTTTRGCNQSIREEHQHHGILCQSCRSPDSGSLPETPGLPLRGVHGMQGSPALLQISPFLHDLVCGEREEKGRLTDSFEPVCDE